MEEETIDVPSSDETMVETPVETPSEVTPEEVPAPVESVPEETLYELPDGRKVDAETLSREWKENFYPDYTRKSQALAAKEINNKPSEEDPLANPEYIPTSYAEIVKIAEQRAIEAIDKRTQETAEQQKALETEVEIQLTSIKSKDPSLDENALFLHANKYHFRDLTLAHQNMKDMQSAMKTVQQTTAKNIAKRADLVSTTQRASTGAKPDPSAFSSARDYFRSLNQ